MRYVVAATLLLVACAKGGQPADDDGDDVGVPDAPSVIDGPAAVIDAPPGTIDARADARPPDAQVAPPDAPPPPPPDAPPMNPPFCSANSDCVEPGTCCFLIACVSGIVIGAQCFPN